MIELLQLLAAETVREGIEQLPHAKSDSITIIVNIVFGIAGSLALLFIVIGSLRYIISRGDPQATAQAKNTIIYALVGLIVTALAYSIVGFVVRNV